MPSPTRLLLRHQLAAVAAWLVFLVAALGRWNWRLPPWAARLLRAPSIPAPEAAGASAREPASAAR